MNLLERELHEPLGALHKSLPAGFDGSPAEIETLGWSVTRDVPLPNLVLDLPVLRSNVRVFQDYVSGHGAELAPHAKATMCPRIWHEQLAAGAWGLTVASVSQLEVCVAYGVPRVLLANELADRHALRRVADLVAGTPWLELVAIVDGVEVARRLADAIAATGTPRRLDVLVELGMPGGRTGVRSVSELVALADAVRELPALRLVGIEGYEGILGVDRDEATLRAVDGYLATWVAGIRGVLPLIERGAPRYASTGGSIYFDRAVAAAAEVAGECTLILRSGCYATHDSVMFDAASPFGSAAPGEHPLLVPALRAYAAVVSRPEPGLAIAGAGARDVPIGEGLPVVHAVHGADGAVRDGAGLTVTKANDHHLYLAVPDGDPLAIGDVVELGLSHPCAVFDRWRVLLLAEGDGRIVGAARTYF